MLAASEGASLASAKDAMLDFMFRRLTAETDQGGVVFSAATAEARQIHWFAEGHVPDTLDGRFGVLCTVMALVLVRLERDGEAGDTLSVALTERFIHVMESEHRELGLGDPTLGRTVRKLVAVLARRTALWRRTIAADDWRAAARGSLYKDEPPTDALDHCAAALKALWSRLDESDHAALAQGKFE